MGHKCTVHEIMVKIILMKIINFKGQRPFCFKCYCMFSLHHIICTNYDFMFIRYKLCSSCQHDTPCQLCNISPPPQKKIPHIFHHHIFSLQSLGTGANDVHEGSFYTVTQLDIWVNSTQFFSRSLRPSHSE